MELMIAHSVMARPSVWLGASLFPPLPSISEDDAAVVVFVWLTGLMRPFTEAHNPTSRSVAACESTKTFSARRGWRKKKKLLLGFLILSFPHINIPRLAHNWRVGWSSFWVPCESIERMRREHVRLYCRRALQGSSCRQHGWLQWKEEINFLWWPYYWDVMPQFPPIQVLCIEQLVRYYVEIVQHNGMPYHAY